MTEEMESTLRFPDPEDFHQEGNFNLEEFKEEYESCLIELAIIIEKVYDPKLRKKLEDLMRDVEDWLT